MVGRIAQLEAAIAANDAAAAAIATAAIAVLLADNGATGVPATPAAARAYMNAPSTAARHLCPRHTAAAAAASTAAITAASAITGASAGPTAGPVESPYSPDGKEFSPNTGMRLLAAGCASDTRVNVVKCSRGHLNVFDRDTGCSQMEGVCYCGEPLTYCASCEMTFVDDNGDGDDDEYDEYNDYEHGRWQTAAELCQYHVSKGSCVPGHRFSYFGPIGGPGSRTLRTREFYVNAADDLKKASDK